MQHLTQSYFWSMGGYGLYVWSAYALTGAVLAWNVWITWKMQYDRARLLAKHENNATSPGTGLASQQLDLANHRVLHKNSKAKSA